MPPALFAPQELEVVRRTERSLATAPLVSLSQRPPLELEPFALPPPASGAPLGYLSLALGIRHLEGPGRLAKAVGLLGSYRSYILCARARRFKLASRVSPRARCDGCGDARLRARRRLSGPAPAARAAPRR